VPFLGPYDDLQYAMLARARADGATAVLTGHGGDHLFGGSPHYLGDWLVRGHLRALHRQARARACEARRPYVLALADGALFPLLPTRLQERVMALRALTAPVPQAWVPRHVGAGSAPPAHAFRDSGPDAWWRRLHRIVCAMGQNPSTGHSDRLARRFGLELRLPLLDARLIDFALRTPPDAFFRGSTMKWILRQSLHDVLPPIVRDRPDKANFTPLSAHGLRRQRRGFVETLLVDSELARRGYVQPDAWRTAILGYLQSDDQPLYWANWRSLTLEMWLRAREGRLPPLEPSPGSPR
jgi:asparagine synthetase B (glutamine-hydrolysing)